MRKVLFVLVVLCVFIVAACDPSAYQGYNSTTVPASSGSGTGGYCGPAQGVPSK